MDDLERRIAVARGDLPADVILRGGRVFDLITGTMMAGDVAISGDRIAGIGDYHADRVIDVSGLILVPGFIDTHLHVESSLVTPFEFDRCVTPRGVTTAICDPHEIANVLGMLIGLTLGVLMRSSAAAIVGYFVYSLVLPAALGTLAAFQSWFADLQPWVDVNFAITRLFDQTMTAEYWQQLGVTTLVWLWIPLAIGLRAVLRAEVK